MKWCKKKIYLSEVYKLIKHVPGAVFWRRANQRHVSSLTQTDHVAYQLLHNLCNNSLSVKTDCNKIRTQMFKSLSCCHLTMHVKISSLSRISTFSLSSMILLYKAAPTDPSYFRKIWNPKDASTLGLHDYGQNDNHNYFDQLCNHDY